VYDIERLDRDYVSVFVLTRPAALHHLAGVLRNRKVELNALLAKGMAPAESHWHCGGCKRPHSFPFSCLASPLPNLLLLLLLQRSYCATLPTCDGQAATGAPAILAVLPINRPKPVSCRCSNQDWLVFYLLFETCNIVFAWLIRPRPQSQWTGVCVYVCMCVCVYVCMCCPCVYLCACVSYIILTLKIDG
jgi:hypothetical protein